MVEKLMRTSHVDVNRFKLENERLREALAPFAKWAQLNEAANPGVISEAVHILAAPCPEVAPNAIYHVSGACFLNAIEVLENAPTEPHAVSDISPPLSFDKILGID